MTARTRRWRAAALLAGLVLVLAACGGGSETPTAETGVDPGQPRPLQPVGVRAVADDQRDGQAGCGLGGRVEQRLEVRPVAGQQHGHPPGLRHVLPGLAGSSRAGCCHRAAGAGKPDGAD